jgi:hypothetical protein
MNKSPTYSFPKRHSGNPQGRPKGSSNKDKLAVRELARKIVESPTYLKNLKARLNNGTASHMEPILFYYAYGKPIDRVAPVTPDGTAYEPGRDTEELVNLAAEIRILLGQREIDPNGSGLPH